MIGWDELGDWITWGLLIFLALVAVVVLVNVVCHAIHAIRRNLRQRRPALSLEEVLERIRDVPYQELPGGGAGDDDNEDDRESLCVICVAPFQPAGEACGVLPECGHVFHKLCVAEWLRRNSTCPLCRTAFTVTDDARHMPIFVSAVENIV